LAFETCSYSLFLILVGLSILIYFPRTREESRAKALQLQNEGSVRESWKMLSQAASIEYKHVKDFIWVNVVFVVRTYLYIL
jgi:hypothetical protein